jgi:DNA-binding NarL/FixJ family response regulator
MTALATSEQTVPETAVVGIVAGDPRTRMRLAGALAAEADLRVHTGTSARALLATGAADDLLVLHLEAVDADALALIAECKREAPELAIVAVCDCTDRRRARRAVDAGVDGLVFSEHLGRALAPTVAAVLSGQMAVPRLLGAGVRAPSLSFREKQILGMVVMGFTNSEIAARLVVAESTVKSHLNGAFRKLGVRSRSEAAALILDPHGSLGPGILAITPGD